MARKTIHVGTISKLDLLHAPKGHQPHLSGTGAFKNRKSDKKLRRAESRRECQD
jgi:hypothetical protein